MSRRMLYALGLVVLSASIFSGRAVAQYPPAVGSITAAASPAITTIGGSADITCTLRDVSGAGVPGQAVTIAITSNLGDARLESNLVRTDSQGVARGRLNVGGQVGFLGVGCQFGSFASLVLIEVVRG